MYATVTPSGYAKLVPIQENWQFQVPLEKPYILKKLDNLQLSNDTTHAILSGKFVMSGYPNLL